MQGTLIAWWIKTKGPKPTRPVGRNPIARNFAQGQDRPIQKNQLSFKLVFLCKPCATYFFYKLKHQLGCSARKPSNIASFFGILLEGT